MQAEKLVASQIRRDLGSELVVAAAVAVVCVVVEAVVVARGYVRIHSNLTMLAGNLPWHARPMLHRKPPP